MFNAFMQVRIFGLIYLFIHILSTSIMHAFSVRLKNYMNT
jgi:hypothetical protein